MSVRSNNNEAQSQDSSHQSSRHPSQHSSRHPSLHSSRPPLHPQSVQSAPLTQRSLHEHHRQQAASQQQPTYYRGELGEGWRYTCGVPGCTSPSGLSPLYRNSLEAFVKHIMEDHLNDRQFDQVTRLMLGMYRPLACGDPSRSSIRGSVRGSARGSVRGALYFKIY